MIAQPRESRALRALLLPMTILSWLAVLLVAAWLLSHIAHAILILVLATLITFALVPLVSLLSRWMPRAAAIAVAYVLGFGLIFGLLAVVVATAASQITTLVGLLPSYAKQAQDLQPQILDIVGRFGVTQAQLNQAESSVIANLQSIGTRVATDTLSVVTSVLSALIDAVLVLILSIYLMGSGPRLVHWLREQAPSGQRRRANLVIAIFNQVVGGYIRGTFTLALLVGTLVGLGMGVLHVRYALLLGILAFFMEFIPILGVFVSGAVCVLIALFQGWLLAVVVLAYFVVVHVIEGDLIGPRIMGRAVGIHPAVALLALVAGTELFGFWGALFGAPIAGLIQALTLTAYREVREAGAPQLIQDSVEEKQATPPSSAESPDKRETA
ncbi:MAG: AI-2E family transporter [Candidatus Dormibacteraeota bacterium]|nr:AI-2E family transporter [Candidatus Dormibacteraeota bacterium]